MVKHSIKLQYTGSKFWLIFWCIFFFPVALTLLLTGAIFEMKGKRYSFLYRGSRFWLCFWVVVCFPIALLLLFLNGFTLDETILYPEVEVIS